jgi:hypothetical protein
MKGSGNLSILFARRATQNQTGPQSQGLRGFSSSRPTFQCFSFILAQVEWRERAPNRHDLSPFSTQYTGSFTIYQRIYNSGY